MKIEETESANLYFMNRFHKYLFSKSDNESKSEFDRYLMEDVEKTSANFDILNWWKVNSIKFPILAKIAQDVLAIPITTVASESAFSTRGRVLDPFRSSLAAVRVEALICSQNWLRAKPLISNSDMVDDVESYKLESGNFLIILVYFLIYFAIYKFYLTVSIENVIFLIHFLYKYL